jgi:hypothetical protein
MGLAPANPSSLVAFGYRDRIKVRDEAGSHFGANPNLALAHPPITP